MNGWPENHANLGVIVLVFGMILPILVSGSDFDSDKEAIRAIRAESNEAIKNHDAAAIVASFADSYQITTGSGQLFHDTPEIEQELWAELLAENPDVIYVRTPDQVEISSYLPRAAESGTWVGNRTSDKGPIELRGTYSASWIKVDGDWKIQSEMFVTLSCSGEGC